MQKLRRGDPAGLEALMDRYTPYLSAIAARVLPGRPQDWEELTADVFLAAWENRRKLQPEKVKGWLAVTMRNRCINRLRALREELPLEEDLLTLSADSPQRALEDQEAARLAGIPFLHAAYGFGKVEGAPELRSPLELLDLV